jgi:ribosomal protein S27AE
MTAIDHEGAGYHEALARDRAPELFAEQAKRPGRFRSSAAEREAWVRSIQGGLSLDALALRVGGETGFQAAKARIWRAVTAITARTVGEARGQRCTDCDTLLRNLRRDGLCAACRKARRARRFEETRATCASCGARLRLAARPDGKPRYCGRCHQVSNRNYLRRRAATDPVYIAFKRAHARWQQRFWAGTATQADKPYLRDYRRAAAAGAPLPNPVPLLREDVAP